MWIKIKGLRKHGGRVAASAELPLSRLQQLYGVRMAYSPQETRPGAAIITQCGCSVTVLQATSPLVINLWESYRALVGLLKRKKITTILNDRS